MDSWIVLGGVLCAAWTVGELVQLVRSRRARRDRGVSFGAVNADTGRSIRVRVDRRSRERRTP